MLTSHLRLHFVTVVACISALVLATDGASLYDYPQYFALDDDAAEAVQDGTQTLGQLMGLSDVGGVERWGDVAATLAPSRRTGDLMGPRTASSRVVVAGGPPSPLTPPPRSVARGLHYLMSPSEDLLREVVVSGPPAPRHAPLRPPHPYDPPHLPDPDLRSLTAILEGLISPGSHAPTRPQEWLHLQHHVKAKRVGPPHATLYPDAALDEPRQVAVKRWWGNYRRPRQQMDRRASQSKHYDCLKSCIKEGKLHPIQCHTLC